MATTEGTGGFFSGDGWLLADPGWRARDNDPHGPSTSVRVVLGGISCRASSLARRTRFGRSDRFPFALPLVPRANSIKNSFREGAYRRFCFRWIEVPRVVRS
jgi:hypothetical protein